jgi:hypothetical protein
MGDRAFGRRITDRSGEGFPTACRGLAKAPEISAIARTIRSEEIHHEPT